MYDSVLYCRVIQPWMSGGGEGPDELFASKTLPQVPYLMKQNTVSSCNGNYFNA